MASAVVSPIYVGVTNPLSRLEVIMQVQQHLLWSCFLASPAASAASRRLEPWLLGLCSWAFMSPMSAV